MTDTAVRCPICDARSAIDETYRTVQLYRCESCDFLFAPARTADELRELYGAEYFEQYPGGEAYEDDSAQRAYEARIRRDLVTRLQPNGRLLEIGAAAGHFLETMRDAGFSVCGVEPADGTAAHGRGRGLDIRTGYVEDVDLGNEPFDAICAWHVVEHLADPVGALRRLRGVIAPTGHLFVEVPNIGSVYARRRGVKWFNLDPAHHVGFYSRSTLRALLEAAGFEVVATETFPALGYVRPRRALRPAEIAVQLKELIDVRARPRCAHPWKHELLRAIARPRDESTVADRL